MSVCTFYLHIHIILVLRRVLFYCFFFLLNKFCSLMRWASGHMLSTALKWISLLDLTHESVMRSICSLMIKVIYFCIDFSIFFTPISILVALVFLLKGIVKPFKQPVAVYYCEKSYKAELMAEEVKALITQLNEQKMSVKVIVNDGGSNMILLRKLLCGDAKWFTVNSQHVCNRKILSLTIVWIFHIKRISIKFWKNALLLCLCRPSFFLNMFNICPYNVCSWTRGHYPQFKITVNEKSN